MKQPILYSILSILLFGLILFSCDVTDSDEGFMISGTVVDENSGNPLAEALVEITIPEELEQSTTTDDDGRFEFRELEIEEETLISIQVSRAGYNNGFAQFAAVPDRDVSVSTIMMRQTSDNGNGGGGDDDGGVPGPSGTPDNIVLANVSNEQINVRETGGNVNSAISVQVQDSSGRALSLNNSVDVIFTRLQGPDDIKISPEVVTTNNNGVATTNITSGFTAGVLKIEAKVELDDGDIIRSTPIPIVIHGGFPDADHSSMYVIGGSDINCPGIGFVGPCTTIGVLLGDKFSNPVKAGTAVYFNSTGGVIQGSGAGHTDADGFVQVDLFSGNPIPNHPVHGPGYAVITSTTIGEDDENIEQEALVLFSGQIANIELEPEVFDIPNGGSQVFELTVTDANGNPMPNGTSIELDVSEGLDIDGGDNLDVKNGLFGGPGMTEFSFILLDEDIEEDNEVDAMIKIIVSTPQNGVTERTFFGTRAKVN